MLLRGGMFGAGLMGFNGLASFVSRGFGQAYGEGISLNDAVRGSGTLTSFNSLRAITEKLGDEFRFLYGDTANSRPNGRRLPAISVASAADSVVPSVLLARSR